MASGSATTGASPRSASTAPSSATPRRAGRTCSSRSTRTRSRSTAARSRRGRPSPACSPPSIANGGSLSDIGPGIDFFAQLKSVGNFLPVQATPQTIASGQTPITIDWDYLNLAYGKNFPASKITTVIPSDAVYGAHYCQAVNADRSASVVGAALAGVPLLRPGAAALAEGVHAPGALHRHGRAQGRAEGAASTRCRTPPRTRR